MTNKEFFDMLTDLKNKLSSKKNQLEEKCSKNNSEHPNSKWFYDKGEAVGLCEAEIMIIELMEKLI